MAGRLRFGCRLPRRPDPHRIPEPGLRRPFPEQSAPRRPVAGHGALRGRDRRHDRSHAPRGDGGGHRHLGWHGVDPAGDEGLSRSRAAGAGHHPSPDGRAADGPRRLRQGRPVLRDRTGAHPGGRRLPSRCVGRRRGRRPPDDRGGRLGPIVPPRHRRPGGGPGVPGGRARLRTPRGRLPGRVRPPLGGAARLPGASLRLPGAGGDVDERRHPQVRVCRQRDLGCPVPGAARCAAASTSPPPTGRGASTCRPHSPAAGPVA